MKKKNQTVKNKFRLYYNDQSDEVVSKIISTESIIQLFNTDVYIDVNSSSAFLNCTRDFIERKIKEV